MSEQPMNGTALVGAHFRDTVPYYGVFGSISIIMTVMITVAFFSSPRIRKEHSSILIQIITTVDLIYTLRFTIGALAWAFGARTLTKSFNFIGDGCFTSTLYGQLTGMLCVSWNAVWSVDFVLILRAPVKARGSQRKWYHLTVAIIVAALAIYVITTFKSNHETCWTRDSTPFFEVLLYIYLSLAFGSLVYAALLLRGGGPLRVVRWRLLKQHASFVVAFLILWSWPLIHRYVDQDDQLRGLTITDSVVSSGQAAIFSLVRLVDQRTRIVFFRVWRRILGYICRPCGRWCARTIISEDKNAPMSMRELVAVDDRLPSEMGEPRQLDGIEIASSPRNSTQRNAQTTLFEPLLKQEEEAEANGLYVPPPPPEQTWMERLLTRVFPQDAQVYTAAALPTSPAISRTPSQVIQSPHAAQPTGKHDYPERSGAVAISLPTLHTPIGTPASGRQSIGGTPQWNIHAYALHSTPVGTPGVLSPLTSPTSLKGAEPSPKPGTSPAGKFVPRRQFTRDVPTDISESWDTTAGLRTEISACILSALCQTVIGADCKRSSLGKDMSSSSSVFGDFAGRFDVSESSSRHGSGNGDLPTVRESDADSLVETNSVTTESTNLLSLASEASKASKLKSKSKDQPGVVRNMDLVEGDALMARIRTTSDDCSGPQDPSECLKQFCPGTRDLHSAQAERCYITGAPVMKMGEFECTSYAEDVFSTLRASARVNSRSVAASFNPSLLRSKDIKAQFTEGASSSFFCRSLDAQLLVKTITADELNALLAMLSDYATHLRLHPESLICRIYCCISIKFSSFPRIYCVLMGNAFPIPKPEQALAGWVNQGACQVFDLKGSTINRSSATRGATSLYLDNDFRKMYPAGIVVPGCTPSGSSLATEMTDALEADANFLRTHGIMDYSLLLNVIPLNGDLTRIDAEAAVSAIQIFEQSMPATDSTATAVNIRHSQFSLISAQLSLRRGSRASTTETDEAGTAREGLCLLQLGIIDLLQTFDYKKQAENRFKTLSSSLTGGRGRNSGTEGGISAVDPDRYCLRFADFMRRVLVSDACDASSLPSA